MKPLILVYDAHSVNLVHDSNVIECPDDVETIKKVCRIIKNTMENVPKKWIDTPIQFKVDLKIGTHWGLGISYEKWLAKVEHRPHLQLVA